MRAYTQGTGSIEAEHLPVCEIVTATADVHRELGDTCGYASEWGRAQTANRDIMALAVTGAKRSPTLPDVPTFGELKMNLGDIENAELWYGFLAPGKTPAAVVEDLNAIIVDALRSPDVRSSLESLDIEVATDTPESFKKLIKADYDRWGAVIRSTGFTLND